MPGRKSSRGEGREGRKGKGKYILFIGIKGKGKGSKCSPQGIKGKGKRSKCSPQGGPLG